MTKRRQVTMWLLVIVVSILMGVAVPTIVGAVDNVAAHPVYGEAVVMDRLSISPLVYRMYDSKFNVVCYLYQDHMECF